MAPKPQHAQQGNPLNDDVARQPRDGLSGGNASGRGESLLRRLKLSIAAAVLLPAVFFAAGAWISAANHPEVPLAVWSRELAMVAVFALIVALLSIAGTWAALKRTESALASGDAAQRSRAEQALLQAQKLEALGRLTGGVAHDFNNLLMVINNNAYLLRRGVQGDAAAPRLSAIERAVESGTKLTRQLLSFSRRQAVNPELIRLQDELPALVDLMRPALGSRISVKTDIDETAAPVRLDRAGLELALLNLAVNASDAMPDRGEVRVELRKARAGEAPNLKGEFVVLGVADTGEGIPEDVQQRVFEPFFSTKPVGKGTGLGLSQVYGFCHQAGGTVTLESAPDEGTTVRLYFPASTEPMAQKDWTPPPVPGVELRQRVLIVEDNDEVAETTRQLLEFLGCAVKRVESGNAAVMRLERDARNFDLVLTDIVMPGGLSGIEVLGYVRDRFPELPVVLMTGYSSELSKLSPDEIVLLKPFSPQELDEALRKALAKKQEAPTQ